MTHINDHWTQEEELMSCCVINRWYQERMYVAIDNVWSSFARLMDYEGLWKARVILLELSLISWRSMIPLGKNSGDFSNCRPARLREEKENEGRNELNIKNVRTKTYIVLLPWRSWRRSLQLFPALGFAWLTLVRWWTDVEPETGPGLGVREAEGRPRRESRTSSKVVEPGLGLFRRRAAVAMASSVSLCPDPNDFQRSSSSLRSLAQV